MLIIDVKKPKISLWGRQLCIKRFAALRVRRAKREKCRWKEKNKSFELCVTINNSIKGHMTLKNSEKRGENKEKWEKFWGHC
jgi:hypothetical protein